MLTHKHSTISELKNPGCLFIKVFANLKSTNFKLYSIVQAIMTTSRLLSNLKKNVIEKV